MGGVEYVAAVEVGGTVESGLEGLGRADGLVVVTASVGLIAGTAVGAEFGFVSAGALVAAIVVGLIGVGAALDVVDGEVVGVEVVDVEVVELVAEVVVVDDVVVVEVPTPVNGETFSGSSPAPVSSTETSSA